LERLTAPIRELGAVPGATYLLDRLLRFFSSRSGAYLYYLMMQPVGSDALLPERLARHLHFREIGPGHPDLRRMAARDEIKVSRFRQEARCLGVYRKDVLIGYVWLCFGAYEEDEVRCTYDLSSVEPAAWDFDLHVFPEHRMSLGFAAIWHAAFEYLRARGVERSYSRVTGANVASLRAHARLGSVRVGYVFFLQLVRFEIALASIAPYWSLTWNSRLILRMPPAVEGSGSGRTLRGGGVPTRSQR
jgi:hypothetical protein